MKIQSALAALALILSSSNSASAQGPEGMQPSGGEIASQEQTSHSGRKPKLPLSTEGCPFSSLKSSANTTDQALAKINQGLQDNLRELNGCISGNTRNAGPRMPSGNSPGGNSPGGNSPGGNSPGGNSPGGNSPGGNSPGGNSPVPGDVDIECLSYQKNLDSEYSRVQSEGASAAMGTEYESCFTTQQGAPIPPGSVDGDCLQSARQSRLNSVSSYCNAKRMTTTRNYVESLGKSLEDLASAAASKPECLKSQTASNILSVASSLAGASGALDAQLASSSIQLVNSTLKLITIMKNQNKIQKLQVSEKFADQACLFWMASKADSGHGCLQKDDKSSCDPKDHPVTRDLQPILNTMGPDRDFQERNAILQQLTLESIDAFGKKLMADREALRKIPINPTSDEAPRAALGLLKTTLDVCMKTSGIWTREKSNIRDVCEQALSCYPHRPVFDNGRQRVNRACQMQRDSDAYFKFISSEVIFVDVGEGKGQATGPGEKPGSQAIADFEQQLNGLSKREYQKFIKASPQELKAMQAKKRETFKERFLKQFPGQTIPSEKCVDQALKAFD
jgi:hypothetical protein